MKKVQSHSFEAENTNKAPLFTKVAMGVALASTMVLADDPTWYTELNTTLSWIAIAVGSVLTTVIAIRLAPLAWIHIKRVIYR